MAHQIQFGGEDMLAEGPMEKSPNKDKSIDVSPTTQCSEDTLHKDGPFDTEFTHRVINRSSAPPGLSDLNFDRLTLDDRDVPKAPRAAGRYVNPHLRGERAFENIASTQTNHRDVPRGNRFRAATAGHSRPTGASFRNAHTWTSPEMQARNMEAQAQHRIEQEFLVIRNSMRRLFKGSEVAKWKLDDYMQHRKSIVAAETKKLANKVQALKELNFVPCEFQPELEHHFRAWGFENANFDQLGNYGRVLGEQTIWCSDWTNGKDEIAPWPTLAEMKWEGDDRAKTKVGRFPPLPREQGPASLAWNQLPVVEQYPMDQVCKIPTMEDIYLPVDADIEEDKQYLWSQQLDKEIWTSLED